MQTDFDVPKEIAVCPICRGALSLEVNEWLRESGAPTEAGCYIDCDTHCLLSYDTGLWLNAVVYAWAKDNVVVMPSKEEMLGKLADWNAGKPLPGGMGR